MNKNVLLDYAKKTGGYVPVPKHLIKKLGLESATFITELWSEYLYRKELQGFNGWFPSTVSNINESCGLSKKRQNTILKNLSYLNLFETTKKGIPNKRHFKLNEENILKLFVEPTSQSPQPNDQMLENNSQATAPIGTTVSATHNQQDGPNQDNNLGTNSTNQLDPSGPTCYPQRNQQLGYKEAPLDGADGTNSYNNGNNTINNKPCNNENNNFNLNSNSPSLSRSLSTRNIDWSFGPNSEVFYAPTLQEFLEFDRQIWCPFVKPREFYSWCEAVDWRHDNGQLMRDWKRLYAEKCFLSINAHLGYYNEKINLLDNPKNDYLAKYFNSKEEQDTFLNELDEEFQRLGKYLDEYREEAA